MNKDIKSFDYAFTILEIEKHDLIRHQIRVGRAIDIARIAGNTANAEVPTMTISMINQRIKEIDEAIKGLKKIETGSLPF